MTTLHIASYLTPLALIAGGILLLIAVGTDLAVRLIPNAVPAGIALLGLLLRLADGNLVSGVLLAAAVFAGATLCWLRGWMGGGDVKLLAAVALFVPPGAVGNLLVMVSLSGGLVGMIYLVARELLRRHPLAPGARPHALLARVLRAERWRMQRGGPVPYATAIALGAAFIIVRG